MSTSKRSWLKTPFYFPFQKPLELDPGHVSDVSYDFGGDLVLKSSKTSCIYVQNLQWKPMGKYT